MPAISLMKSRATIHWHSPTGPGYQHRHDHLLDPSAEPGAGPAPRGFELLYQLYHYERISTNNVTDTFQRGGAAGIRRRLSCLSSIKTQLLSTHAGPWGQGQLTIPCAGHLLHHRASTAMWSVSMVPWHAWSVSTGRLGDLGRTVVRLAPRKGNLCVHMCLWRCWYHSWLCVAGHAHPRRRRFPAMLMAIRRLR